jgi:transaldolase
MKATQLLHNFEQSIWLNNITCDLLESGTLKSYIDDLSVPGLTSNPTIFNHAIKNSTAYGAEIQKKLAEGVWSVSTTQRTLEKIQLRTKPCGGDRQAVAL